MIESLPGSPEESKLALKAMVLGRTDSGFGGGYGGLAREDSYCELSGKFFCCSLRMLLRRPSFESSAVVEKLKSRARPQSFRAISSTRGRGDAFTTHAEKSPPEV